MIDHEEISLIGTKRKPGLLDWIRAREMLVPEFQREFLWERKPDKTASLLASIAQEWPAGALLLMEGDRGFQTKVLQGWKKEPKIPTKAIRYAILDGQQRLTALYQAFYGRSKPYVFAVAVGELLNSGEVDPEEGGTFRAFGRKTWDRKYGSMDNQRADGLIALEDLVNPRAWDHWKDGFHQDESEDLSELREDGALAGLLRYQFPVSIVLQSAPDEALASIFVTINQQGIKLTTFDLVVARTVKRKRGKEPGFNLREVWERAAGREETEDEPPIPAKYERLRNFGIDPEIPLRLVRLIIDSSSKLSDTSIIRLDPAEVRQRIQRALEALEKVLAFLEERIGLIPPTLPDSNYLLPLALAAHGKPAVLKNQRDSEHLLRWYWAATFRSLFGRGRTGDEIPKQATKLSDWVVQRGPEPEVTAGFWPAFRQQELARFVQGTAQNQHFMRAVFALEVAEGATDWKGLPKTTGGGSSAFRLRDAGTWPPTSLDVHHIWARGVKKPPKTKRRVQGLDVPHGPEAHESVVNRCLLLKETNISIGNTPFSNVVKLEGVRAGWMSTYLLDAKARDWPGFVDGRIRKVRAALARRVPSG